MRNPFLSGRVALEGNNSLSLKNDKELSQDLKEAAFASRMRPLVEQLRLGWSPSADAMAPPSSMALLPRWRQVEQVIKNAPIDAGHLSATSLETCNGQSPKRYLLAPGSVGSTSMTSVRSAY